MAATRIAYTGENKFDMSCFTSEDELKAHMYSVKIESPKINESVRDQSVVITFPRGSYSERLTRGVLEKIMKEKWGDELFDHVVHFGNVDFSRRWIFHFDSQAATDKAVSTEIFLNNYRIIATHATKKFNIIKIDWVPVYVQLQDLANLICKVKGVTGKFVDIRWARGDHIQKDSTQAIMRLYSDPLHKFEPPSYLHYFDEYNNRVFLHLSAMGQESKCMKCNEVGHNVTTCPLFFCKKCGKLRPKHFHECEGDEVGERNSGEEKTRNSPTKPQSYSDKAKSTHHKSTLLKKTDDYVSDMVVLSKSNKANHTPPTPQDPSHKKNKQSAPFNSTPLKNSIIYDRNSDMSRRTPDSDKGPSSNSHVWTPMWDNYDSAFPGMPKSNSLDNTQTKLNLNNNSPLNFIMEKITNKTNDASRDASLSSCHRKTKHDLNDLSKVSDDSLIEEIDKEINVDDISNIDIDQSKIINSSFDNSKENFFDNTKTEYH